MNMRFGKWNVGSLYRTGISKTVVREMKNVGWKT
jgi:hypothetical protein